MRTLCLLLCLVAAPALAQIQVPDVVAPYDPIVAGCNCIIPKEGEAAFLWRVDNAAKSIATEAGNKLHIWAPPGPHWIEAIVLVKTYELYKVSVTDPGDPTKTILVERRFITEVDVQQYKKDYAVGTSPVPPPGPGPPPPGPGPGPGPGPTDPFAAHVRKLLESLGTAYSKEKALKIADNYEGVASRAVATSEVPDLAAFVALTALENGKVLTVEERMVWGPKFFDPGLSKYQFDQFKLRNLTATSVPGIALLWRDTAAAIRAAVY